MNQAFEFLRFGFVGFLNTVLDASVLNLLLLATGRQELVYYSLFKTASFTIAVVFSYFMNKSFVFNPVVETRQPSVNNKPSYTTGRENKNQFFKFIVISIIGALFNVGLATLGNKVCGNFLGQHLFILCANLGFLLGAGATLAWNFFGYKFFVFQDKKQTPNAK